MATGGSANTDLLSEETFDFLCRICKRKGKYQEAENFCVECADYYCSACITVHEDVPILSGHKILDKGQLSLGSVKAQPSTQSTALPVVLTEKCEMHSHQFIDMYCQNHDHVGCGTCMATDHRSCSDIFYLPEFLGGNASAMVTTTAQDSQLELESVAKALQVHHETIQLEKQQLLDRKDATLEKIREFRKEINDRLDELEENSKTDLDDKYEALVIEIDERMEMLEAEKAAVTSALDKLASTVSCRLQAFVNAKKGKYIAKKATKFIEDQKAQTLSLAEDIDFEADIEIPAFLENVDALGNITQRITGNAESNISAGSDVIEEALLQVKSREQYCVKVHSDKTKCDIVSACSLEDGTIILADHGNSKLKRLHHSKYTVTDFCDLTEDPWQICSVNQNSIAVSLPIKKEVQFISLGNEMKVTNKITTNFECFGVAYAGGSLYISDSESSIFVYSVLGQRQKSFTVNKLFCNIHSLAVSKDGSKIYVADNNNGLIIMDNTGEVVGKYIGSQLDGAFDTFVLGNGSLLVSGGNSNNVLQFGLNGELIGEVVKSDKDVNTQAICCSQQMSALIIGRWDDIIEVYDLM